MLITSFILLVPTKTPHVSFDQKQESVALMKTVCIIFNVLGQERECGHPPLDRLRKKSRNGPKQLWSLWLMGKLDEMRGEVWGPGLLGFADKEKEWVLALT